jgi:hypothetical protein
LISPRIGFLSGAAPGLGRPEGAGRAEARPLHDDLMSPASVAIERAVGEDRVVEERDPFPTAQPMTSSIMTNPNGTKTVTFQCGPR